MREVLLQGRCVDGLYPLPSSSTSSIGHHVHGAVKSSSSLLQKSDVFQKFCDF
jgi:hypothetical protein